MSKFVLSEIWIYPIKSLGGIRVKSAKIFEKGLEHDRRWMLIDSDNEFMSQRLYPKMALFKLQVVVPIAIGAGFRILHRNDSIVCSPP